MYSRLLKALISRVTRQRTNFGLSPFSAKNYFGSCCAGLNVFGPLEDVVVLPHLYLVVQNQLKGGEAKL